MQWLVALMCVLAVVVAVVLLLVRRNAKPEPGTDFDSEEFLAEYFALEEFNDEDLRDRLEHLRGVPELR